MATKPSRLLDWISDDSVSKYTAPSGAQQLAGHQDATNADAKVFNWAWWRCSQWIEFLDNTFDTNGKDINAPKSTTITETITPTASCVTLDSGGIKSWDGLSNAIFSVTEAGAVSLGYSGNDVISLTTGVISVCTATSADLVKLHALTASAADINVLLGTNSYGLVNADLDKLADITANSSEINQLDGVSVGGNTSGDILTTDDVQTEYSKIIYSCASGQNIKRCIFGTEITAYDDRGDATVDPLFKMFNGNYMLDLGNENTNPSQNTWGGIRVICGTTGALISNFSTSAGNGAAIGSAHGNVVQAQSLNDSADYGFYTTGSFNKGFLKGTVETGGPPSHTADSGSFWLDSSVELYLNTDGSTTWAKIAKDLDVIHGSGSANYWRKSYLFLEDGTNANTVKATLTSKWNGDTISVTDNIPKGGSSGNFSLSASGDVLTISNSGLSGNFIEGISVLFYNEVTGVDYFVETLYNASGMQVKYTASGGGVVDLTAVVDFGDHKLDIFYMTSA